MHKNEFILCFDKNFRPNEFLNNQRLPTTCADELKPCVFSWIRWFYIWPDTCYRSRAFSRCSRRRDDQEFAHPKDWLIYTQRGLLVCKWWLNLSLCTVQVSLIEILLRIYLLWTRTSFVIFLIIFVKCFNLLYFI